ncbi:acetolactate synthase large subunit, partial [Pseudarthrobacter equi]
VTVDRLTVLGAAADDNAAALEALADRLGAPAVAPVRTSAECPAIGERLTADAIVEELVAQLPEDAVISLEGSTLGGPYLR